LRQADVIVSTCIGAADSRLLAACGYTVSNDDDEDNYSVGKKRSHDKTKKSTLERSSDRGLAPDRMPPIFLPFVILDESCQCVEPSSLVPIFSSNSCQSLVMLGDPCQLPPTVLSDDSGNGSSQLSLSLMSRLAMMLPTPSSSNSRIKEETDETFLSSGATKQAKSIIKFRSRESTSILKKRYLGAYLLSIQYRMHPSISAFSSAIFYDGKLQTPLNLRHDRLFPAALDSLFQINDRTICVRFVNISGNFEIRGGKENSSESGIENFSISNEKEAVQVVSLIKNFLIQSEIGDGFSGSIGVVTPYSAQVSLLEALIASDTELLEIVGRCRCSIEINSVDAYQGRERDVIIFSAVRSNELGKVGFLSDWRRMNVALTRAKSGLIVVGDLQTLKKGDMHWDAFCSWLETLGCVYDLSDVP
jgi:superfamily I DNA and/or RNA helicase